MENAEADCRAVLERLYLYLDGELPVPDCAGIDRHLQQCAECFDHVDFERDLKEIVRKKCTESSVPDALLAKVRERLRDLESR